MAIAIALIVGLITVGFTFTARGRDQKHLTRNNTIVLVGAAISCIASVIAGLWLGATGWLFLAIIYGIRLMTATPTKTDEL